MVRFRAVAVDRNINNIALIPLDVATPPKTPAGAAPKATAKPALTTPSGLPPAGEKFTGTQQRSSFGKLVAAFLIAAAIVMLVARLFGLVATRLGQPRVMGEVVAGIALGPSVLGAISPNLQADALPQRHPPGLRGGGQPRADLLRLPHRARVRPDASCGAGWRRPRRSRTPASRCRWCWGSPSPSRSTRSSAPTSSSSRSPSSWASRCRSRRSPCSPASWSSGACSSAPWGR